MDKLTELTRAYEELGKEIELLKNPIPEPWEPKHHGYVAPKYLGGPVEIMCDATPKANRILARHGLTYPNHEAAEKASEFFYFYQRLYALAFEMNQTYVESSECHLYEVYFQNSTKKWTAGSAHGLQGNSMLFNSRQAAQEAAHIMNRDHWTLPTL